MSVFFSNQDNDENDFIEDAIDAFDEKENIDLREALDDYEEIGNFYMYHGSQTEPNCHENVTWFIWGRV